MLWLGVLTRIKGPHLFSYTASSQEQTDCNKFMTASSEAYQSSMVLRGSKMVLYMSRA